MNKYKKYSLLSFLVSIALSLILIICYIELKPGDWILLLYPLFATIGMTMGFNFLAKMDEEKRMKTKNSNVGRKAREEEVIPNWPSPPRESYTALELQELLKEYNRERFNLELEDGRYTPDNFLKWLREREDREKKEIKYSLRDLQNMYARFLIETGVEYKNNCIPSLMPGEFIIWMEKLLAGEVK